MRQHYAGSAAAFVVYPVGYGLWLARHPSSYVALYNDPIFARAAVNTLISYVILLASLAIAGHSANELTIEPEQVPELIA